MITTFTVSKMYIIPYPILYVFRIVNIYTHIKNKFSVQDIQFYKTVLNEFYTNIII